ncbi:Os05g0488100, partial [Oryza sativa Japonica Group]
PPATVRQAHSRRCRSASILPAAGAGAFSRRPSAQGHRRASDAGLLTSISPAQAHRRNGRSPRCRLLTDRSRSDRRRPTSHRCAGTGASTERSEPAPSPPDRHGGLNTPENCAIIQGRANRNCAIIQSRANRRDDILDEMEVAALASRINWTEYQLASIEAAAIGNIIRDGKVIEIAPNSKGGPLQDVLRSLLEKNELMINKLCDEDAPLESTASRPLSGFFFNTLCKEPGYLAFDTIRCGKLLYPESRFAALPEPVSFLASTRGLVCVCGKTTGLYYVTNTTTFKWVQLPRHSCDHGEPAVVITFEEPLTSCFDGAVEHYHVVAAFHLKGSVWTSESYSSRTGRWTIAKDAPPAVEVKAESGVGTLGCAFWRTSLGSILCYDPGKDLLKVIPAPRVVNQDTVWELGQMEGDLTVTCFKDVDGFLTLGVLKINKRLFDDKVAALWTVVGSFSGEKVGKRAMLLRSQGAAEVVVWEPLEERVVAMDLEGLVTGNFGPLTNEGCTPCFVPYVPSSVSI